MIQAVAGGLTLIERRIANGRLNWNARENIERAHGAEYLASKRVGDPDSVYDTLSSRRLNLQTSTPPSTSNAISSRPTRTSRFAGLVRQTGMVPSQAELGKGSRAVSFRGVDAGVSLPRMRHIGLFPLD